MKKLYIFYSILVLFATSIQAQYLGGDGDGHHKSKSTQITLFGVPQGNQAIYSGGNGDGFHKLLLSSTLDGEGLDIFVGGRGDGFVKEFAGGSLDGGTPISIFYSGGGGDGFVKAQHGGSLDGMSVDVLYTGGGGDGFDKQLISSFLSGAIATFFNGGNGDGFAKIASVSDLGGGMLTMFNGGGGDGFTKINAGGSLSGFNAANIYNGGEGDGFDTQRYDGVLTPFPVALLSFDAFPQETFVLLQWVTEQETNNDFFTIERTKDGSAFEEIADVPSQGDSESIQSYETEDPNPLLGASYYRLKWTDLDGVSDYSNLVEVFYEIKDDFSMVIFPNPNDGNQLNLTLSGLTKDDELAVEVFDMTGKMVFVAVDPHHNTAGNTFALDLKGQLAEGSYVVRVLKNEFEQASKILIVTK